MAKCRTRCRDAAVCRCAWTERRHLISQRIHRERAILAKQSFFTVPTGKADATSPNALQIIVGEIAKADASEQIGKSQQDGETVVQPATGEHRLFSVRNKKFRPANKRGGAITSTVRLRDGLFADHAEGKKKRAPKASGKKGAAGEQAGEGSETAREDKIAGDVLRFGLDALHQFKPGTIPNKAETNDSPLKDAALPNTISVDNRSQIANAFSASNMGATSKNGSSVVTTTDGLAGVRSLKTKPNLSVVITDTLNTHGAFRRVKSETISFTSESRIDSTVSKDVHVAHLVNVELATFERDLFSDDAIVSGDTLVDSRALASLASSVSPKEVLAEDGTMTAAVMKSSRQFGKRSATNKNYSQANITAGTGENEVVNSTEMLVDTLVTMQWRGQKADPKAATEPSTDATRNPLPLESAASDSLSLDATSDDALAIDVVFADTPAKRPTLVNAVFAGRKWLNGDEAKGDDVEDVDDEVTVIHGVSIAMMYAVRAPEVTENADQSTETSSDIAADGSSSTEMNAGDLWRKNGFASGRMEAAENFLFANTGNSLDQWCENANAGSSIGRRLSAFFKSCATPVFAPVALAVFGTAGIGVFFFAVRRRRPAAAKAKTRDEKTPSVHVTAAVKRAANRKVQAAAERT